MKHYPVTINVDVDEKGAPFISDTTNGETRVYGIFNPEKVNGYLNSLPDNTGKQNQWWIDKMKEVINSTDAVRQKDLTLARENYDLRIEIAALKQKIKKLKKKK